MTTIFITSIKTLAGFFVLLLLTRLLGKKQLSQMTFFTYITGITLGSITSEMMVNRDVDFIDGITCITLWAILTLIVEYISLKSSKARVLLDGEPTIVIRNGKIIEKAMASNKLNMDDLSMLLRTKNVFSVAEVAYAILEPNGQLSVLRKEDYQQLTKKDMNLPKHRRKYLPTELIVDGKIVTRNLVELQLTEKWLLQQLNKQGIHAVEEVFFAELQSDGSIFLDKKQKSESD